MQRHRCPPGLFHGGLYRCHPRELRTMTCTLPAPISYIPILNCMRSSIHSSSRAPSRNRSLRGMTCVLRETTRDSKPTGYIPTDWPVPRWVNFVNVPTLNPSPHCSCPCSFAFLVALSWASRSNTYQLVRDSRTLAGCSLSRASHMRTARAT